MGYRVELLGISDFVPVHYTNSNCDDCDEFRVITFLEPEPAPRPSSSPPHIQEFNNRYRVCFPGSNSIEKRRRIIVFSAYLSGTASVDPRIKHVTR